MIESYLVMEEPTASRVSAPADWLAAATLVVIWSGSGSIVLWRAYTGTSARTGPHQSARLLQCGPSRPPSKLVEENQELEVSQQESIDQLQVVQDQLQTVRRLLAAQQSDGKRLSEQVQLSPGAIDALRQSFASAELPRHPVHPREITSIRSRASAR